MFTAQDNLIHDLPHGLGTRHAPLCANLGSTMQILCNLETYIGIQTLLHNGRFPHTQFLKLIFYQAWSTKIRTLVTFCSIIIRIHDSIGFK